ncbi:MAG: maleylpyruvate isomerase family mycothiol-dependent enzyme [Sciscionella sp.]
MSSQALLAGDRYLPLLHGEAELIVYSARGGRPDLPVPGCPGMTLAEIERHLGAVYRSAEAWLRDGARPHSWQRQPELGQSLEDYLRSGLAALVDRLKAAPASEPAATWWPRDATNGFWRRRMTHETTVHRVDVQYARGVEISPIEPDLAVDGIDEVLRLWFGHRALELGLSGTKRASVLIRTAERKWLAVTGSEKVDVRRVPAGEEPATDAVISGEPMWLYLWLWGRLSIHQAEVQGDRDAVAQLWALLRLATR